MGEAADAKAERILSIYSRLKQGKFVYKAEESMKYDVAQRTIQRDLSDIQCFLNNQNNEAGEIQEIVFDRKAGGYRLETKRQNHLNEKELLAICKVLLDSRSLVKEEMFPIINSLLSWGSGWGETFNGSFGVGHLGALNMDNKIMGYARVSSKEQNLDRQIMQLKEYVAEADIIVDKASGKDFQRAGYQALKGVLGLREGDTLVITSLDRLSRNKADIKNELQWFQKRNIRLKILDLPTSLIEIPEGQEWIREMIQNILIEVLSSIAEQERLTIRKRQREGIEVCEKKRGVHMGRPRLVMPEEFPLVYDKWKDGEITARVAMQRLKLSGSSFYRMVKRYEAGEQEI